MQPAHPADGRTEKDPPGNGGPEGENTTQGKGIILYPEDLGILSRTLDAADAFPVILALSEYAEGREPDENALTCAQRVAYYMMRQKVDIAMNHYADKVRKCSEAAKSRHRADRSAKTQEREEAEAPAEPVQQEEPAGLSEEEAAELYAVCPSGDIEEEETDASADPLMRVKDFFGEDAVTVRPQEKTAAACGRRKNLQTETLTQTETQTVTQTQTQTQTRTEEEGEYASAPAADGKRIRDMLRECGMPVTDLAVGAVRSDLRRFGEEKVREAMRQAQLANSREFVSVRFYRAFLTDRPKKPEAAYHRPPDRDPMQRHTYTPEEFRKMSIDLDEEEF